jgi:2-polyprenyl-3-methyl-5-hydroxy-6-metoxy-1,4-benzoquinol methylase
MEVLNQCPICSANKFTLHVKCLDYIVSRETFTIVRCLYCGFLFTNPRPDEKEIDKYYMSEKYIPHSGTNKRLINKVYGIVRKYTIKKKVQLINRLSNHKVKNKRILDIGAGTGDFLNACKKYGWSINGVEPSPIARQKAKQKFGLYFYKDVFSLPLNEENGKHDVITMWHVLEHVHKLHQTINHIKNVIADEGILIIAVPNCNSWDSKKYGEHWAAYDLPRHLYHFVQKDIERLFSKFGFQLSKVIPMKFDSYYVSLLSEEYKTGKQQFITGLWNGFISNINAKQNGYSSHIYVLNRYK